MKISSGQPLPSLKKILDTSLVDIRAIYPWMLYPGKYEYLQEKKYPHEIKS